MKTKMCPVRSPLSKLKEFLQGGALVPERDQWRLHVLVQYVKIRDNQVLNISSTEYIDNLIVSLCTT